VVAITAALLVVLREFLSDVVSPEKVINVPWVRRRCDGSFSSGGCLRDRAAHGPPMVIDGLILGGLELGTGILLIATDTLSRGVMITVGTWALASGTLLIVEVIRARGRARSILEGARRP
jgi:hypothetical protein